MSALIITGGAPPAIRLPPFREHQAEGYARLRAAVARLLRTRPGQGAGVVAVAPPGYGKTRIALEVANGAREKGKRTGIFAAKQELIDQPMHRVLEAGWPREDLQVITAGETIGRDDASLVIASVQTLLARGLRPQLDTAIWDECRHFVAPEWFTVAGDYKHIVRVGLDATPARADGAPLGDLFDELVELATIGWLTENRWLVPQRLLAPESEGKDLAETPLAFYEAHARGLRAIVFCKSIAESKRQTQEFILAGYRAVHLDGKTPTERRRTAIERLRTGEVQVVCNQGLLTEGLDVPELDCIIVARGVAHESTWVQILGRNLRTEDGQQLGPHHRKQVAIVGDLLGQCHRHGFIADARTWHLEGKALRRADDIPGAVMCRSCFAWNRGPACLVCGAKLPPPPPPRVTKRELKEQRQANAPRHGREWELWLDLVRTAAMKGWKPQAASMRFKAITGRWPVWGQKLAEEELRAHG